MMLNNKNNNNEELKRNLLQKWNQKCVLSLPSNDQFLLMSGTVDPLSLILIN